MSSIGDLFFSLRGDGTRLDRDAETAGKRAGDRAGLSFAQSFAAVGAVAGAATAILAPMATAADDALDAVRASTGLIGDELVGVQDVFRQVAGSVPDDLQTVSSVVGELQTRTGLTGEGLRTLAEQVLDFSRATGTDAASNVALVTRLFGDWDVATEHQAGTLDMLLRAAQATGIPVDALQQSLVQYGAPLRQMGFSLEEATALLGKFEKEGVNSELVMGSLRIALGKMARAGEEAPETFQRVVAEIERLGPSAEGTAMAMELFGARAGADMAAAIQEGRFEIGALFDQISNGGETVQSVTADTEDAADGFKGFLNTAVLALGEFAAPLAGFSEVAGPMLYSLPLLTSGLGWLTGALASTTAGTWLLKAAQTALLGPIGLVVLAIGALFVAWETNFLGIRDIVDTIFGWIEDEALPWITGIFDAIADAVSTAVGVIVGVIEGILGVVSTVASAIEGFFDFITGGTATAKRQIDSVGAKPRTSTVLASGRDWEAQRRAQGFAVGAWNVPGDMLALIHKGEMIIPATEAEAIRQGRSMAATGTGGDSIVRGPIIYQLNYNGAPRTFDNRDDFVAALDTLTAHGGRVGD